VVAALVATVPAAASAQAWERGSSRVKTGFGDAVTAPLNDLNVRRDEIPPVLVEAVADTYGLKNLDRCEAYAHEIRRLDMVLGPDVDMPDPTVADGRTRGAEAVADAALEAIKDTTTDVIPFRSWVRRLSGAAAHDKRVKAALLAGTTRRSFLKGVGYANGCSAPAAPHGMQQAKAPKAAPTLLNVQPVSTAAAELAEAPSR
jgi:hypothetical protein